MSNTNQAHRRKKERKIFVAECFKKGYSTMTIVEKTTKKFNISERTVKNDIRDALDWLHSYDDCNFIKDIRAKQIQRSEYLLENDISEKKWDSANRIIDTLNKLLGLYENKQKIEITSNEIQFKFGGIDGGEEDNNL